MPSFFNEGLGLSPHIAGFYLVLPELCGAVFTALGGAAAGRLGGSGGWEPTPLRKLFSGIGFVGAGLAMLLLATANGPVFASLALCIEGSLNAMHGSGFKANYQVGVIFIRVHSTELLLLIAAARTHITIRAVRALNQIS